MGTKDRQSSSPYRERARSVKANELLDEADIDLLFSDIVMPNDMNAYELAQRVRRSYPQLKILLTSDYDRKFSIIEQNGGPFLTKLNKTP